MQHILVEKKKQIQDLCEAHHVQRLAVFGSASRDDFNLESSDVDLLVEFKPIVPRYVRNFFAFEEALTALFARRVDLLTFESVHNPYLLRSIQADQKIIYAA